MAEHCCPPAAEEASLVMIMHHLTVFCTSYQLHGMDGHRCTMAYTLHWTQLICSVVRVPSVRGLIRARLACYQHKHPTNLQDVTHFTHLPFCTWAGQFWGMHICPAPCLGLHAVELIDCLVYVWLWLWLHCQLCSGVAAEAAFE